MTDYIKQTKKIIDGLRKVLAALEPLKNDSEIKSVAKGKLFEKLGYAIKGWNKWQEVLQWKPAKEGIFGRRKVRESNKIRSGWQQETIRHLEEHQAQIAGIEILLKEVKESIGLYKNSIIMKLSTPALEQKYRGECKRNLLQKLSKLLTVIETVPLIDF